MERQGIAEYEAEIQRMKKALRGMTHHMQQINDQRKYYNRVSCELSDKLEEQRNEIHELRMRLDRR